MTRNEIELITAAQNGDREAFGILVERYKGHVYATAFSITTDHGEAQDLAQETFIRAMQNLPRLQDRGKFPAWLRGITYTVGQDVRRKVARERRHLQAAAQQRPQEGGAADQALSEQELGEKETGLLEELVASLPENCRMALDLRFRQGLSYAEIGEVLGVPASTVRGLLYRGTRTLRLKLKPMLKRTRGE